MTKKSAVDEIAFSSFLTPTPGRTVVFLPASIGFIAPSVSVVVLNLQLITVRQKRVGCGFDTSTSIKCRTLSIDARTALMFSALKIV